MLKPRTKQLTGYAGVLASAVIFGFTPVLAALSYQGGSNGVNMAFLRAVLPLPVLYALARRHPKPDAAQRRLGAVLGLLLFGCALLLYSSYAYIPVGLAMTLHFLYPLYVVLYEWLVQRRSPGALRLAGLVLGLSGSMLFLQPGEGALHPAGLLLALLSGVCYAGYIVVLSRESQRPMPLYRLMFEVSRSGAVLCLVAGLLLGRLTLRLTPQAWVCAVLVALLAAVVACVLFQAGVRIVGKANAAIFSLLEPITSIVFSVLLLGDALSPAKLTGCALILAGLLVTALYKPPKT